MSAWRLRDRGRLVLVWGALVWLVGCGGGGSGASDPVPGASLPEVPGLNAQALVVDAGPSGLSTPVVNMPYTSVRICVPGTSTCQTIDHVLVDTGSTGLRLLDSELSLSLPSVSAGSGTLYNCAQFLDQTYLWGAVHSADLYMGGANLNGERAASLPIQVVGTAGAPAVPAACAPTGFTAKDTLNAMGARGILGIGHHAQDCGSGCTLNAANGYYYVRNSGAQVSGTAVALGEQLQQPIGLFANDNNGALISLPAIGASGAARAQGSLVFGIGTQSNNQPGAARAMTLNASGYFSTVFNGRTLNQGFVDSGSNALFFGTRSYPLCVGAAYWYCPQQSLSLQASNTGADGQSSTVSFSVANANNLLGQTSTVAFDNLAGPIGDNVSFDFGLPFFYGRQVFTAIQGRSTPLGNGPYVAY